MILQFKTPRNSYGHRKYLCIDTVECTYTTFCPKMIVEGIEIRNADYKELIENLNAEGYIENKDIA